MHQKGEKYQGLKGTQNVGNDILVAKLIQMGISPVAQQQSFRLITNWKSGFVHNTRSFDAYRWCCIYKILSHVESVITCVCEVWLYSVRV